jgi:hypothetical protein
MFAATNNMEECFGATPMFGNRAFEDSPYAIS